MVPRAVLMKSGLVSVNTARQVSAAHSKTTVNAVRPMSYLSNSAHSTVKMPIKKNTTFKHSNINQKIQVSDGLGLQKNVADLLTKAFDVSDSKLQHFLGLKQFNVNTTCYAQNRVLVVKPHNKTPYKLFHGRIPTLSFMRPFGCPVTILNTTDHLGKFDGKADEETRIVEMKTCIFGLRRNTPNVVGTQSYGFAGTKASDNACQARKGRKNLTNNVNAASTNEVNAIGGKTSIKLPFDPNMPTLEDYSIFDSSRDDGAEADMNNLETTIQVSPIPTTRIHNKYY
ncbi:hypothetical protein Tco_0072133 [Tanacetum coccineum]